uniref:G-patch domain containing 3 n=1 Tax=Latimeria chalumnae TaxID=7897 RepID=H3ATH3_LATCH
MAAPIVYCVVSNIPASFRSADLRNYFSQFIESGGFACFHYRHRPELLQVGEVQKPCGTGQGGEKAAGKPGPFPAGEAGGLVDRTPRTRCCLATVQADRVERFMKMYSGTQWVDPDGNWLGSCCVIRRVRVSSETDPNSFPYRTKKELKNKKAQSEIFTHDDLRRLPELNPPALMPNGNVGTPVKVFLELIQACRLPPRLIKKLGLKFPKTGSNRRYGNVPFEYWDTETIEEEEAVYTATGAEISGRGTSPVGNQKKLAKEIKSNEQNEQRNEEEEEEEDDDDEGEESHSDDVNRENAKKNLNCISPSRIKRQRDANINRALVIVVSSSHSANELHLAIDHNCMGGGCRHQILQLLLSKSCFIVRLKCADYTRNLMDKIKGRHRALDSSVWICAAWRKLKKHLTVKGSCCFKFSNVLISLEQDNDTCEEWERHEALHEDVTNQERTEERLFEEEIELKWEKGGSGLVFYTDAQYWQEEKGDFDEQTADDWDVDMSIYYDKDGGDKDARDYVQMRLEQRLREGLEDGSVTNQRIGNFEQYTKGIGRKVMEKQGWKEGLGLGSCSSGMAEALDAEGQNPKCRRGLGYHGEKLQTFVGKKRRREAEVVISTIYDQPEEIDRGDSLLRRQPPTSMKYRPEVTFVRRSADSKQM